MVEYRLLTSDELNAALRIVLAPTNGGRVTNQQIDAFLSYIEASRLSLDRQWGAFDGRRLLTSCLRIISPGRSAVVFLPQSFANLDDRAIAVRLLQCLIADAPACDLRLMQAMVEPGRSKEEAILTDAGFRFLAELIYMQRGAQELFGAARLPAPEGTTWVTYTRERHALFAETVAATYVDSLDCPGLSGVRTIEDTLATHRATGEFDERRWFVLMQHGVPAGVLLLTHVPARDAMDVVYMGLSPEFRGRGLGRAMIHQAIKTARDASCALITLAVDAANTPSLRLYQKCGFAETTRRRAWIVAPGR